MLALPDIIELDGILDAIKTYGPVGVAAIVIIWYQWRKIDQLIDLNGSAFRAEIERMAAVQNRLLDRLIGPQSSSANAPTMRELTEAAKVAPGVNPQ